MKYTTRRNNPLDEQRRSREGEPPDERDQTGEEEKIIHDPCHASPPRIPPLAHCDTMAES
jgi:hypothetical protein